MCQLVCRFERHPWPKQLQVEKKGLLGLWSVYHGEKESMQQSAAMPIVNILSQSPFSPIDILHHYSPLVG
jgi:hypothetical protein